MKNKEGIFIDEYDLLSWSKEALNYKENGYNLRCEYCYTSRLKKVFEYARDNGYTAVTTTLLISPYQKHDIICKVCETLANKYGVKFMYKDFRPMFWDGQYRARELGLYRQKYCGCIFSMEDNHSNSNSSRLTISEGYKALRTPRLQVKKIENKEHFIDMLLEADPSKSAINKYLNDSDMYGLKLEDEIICIASILYIDRKTVELKNLVTKSEYRNKGYARILLKSLFGNLKQKYDKIIVGTTENNIPFYVKQGFDKYEKTIKNFFIENYEEEIWNGNLHCTDLIYYSKDLKKKCNQ